MTLAAIPMCRHERRGPCARCSAIACADCDFCFGCERIICEDCETHGPAFSFPGDRTPHPHARGMTKLVDEGELAMERI